MTSPAHIHDVLAIGKLVEPLVIAAGLELWDVEISPRAVRVLVDRPGGVDLEAIGALAKAVSASLDAREDLTPKGQYQLEVSSPGLERTLRTPRHYQRFVGTVVSVKTEAPIEGSGSGSRRLQGVLLAADGAGITIELPVGTTDFRYDQIQKAHTVLLWGPTAKTRATKSKDSAAARSDPMKDLAR
jgi:ribosome maturation factor RimP